MKTPNSYVCTDVKRCFVYYNFINQIFDKKIYNNRCRCGCRDDDKYSRDDCVETDYGSGGGL